MFSTAHKCTHNLGSFHLIALLIYLIYKFSQSNNSQQIFVTSVKDLILAQFVTNKKRK